MGEGEEEFRQQTFRILPLLGISKNFELPPIHELLEYRASNYIAGFAAWTKIKLNNFELPAYGVLVTDGW